MATKLFGLGSTGRGSRALVVAVSAAALLGIAGQASADRDRGRSGRDYKNNLCKPIHTHHHHGRGHSHHHGGGSSVSVNIGSWGYGSGWSVGYRSGYRRDCDDYSYRRPVCPPVIVTNPCPPTVVYRDRVVYDTPVVVERPVYVDRVVEKPVVVERPVIIEKPVERVVERVVEKPVYVDQTTTVITTGNYRDRELGDAYMRMSDWSNAIRVYNRYLAAWDKDGTATRNIGLAQIGAGFTQDGFRNVVRGHQLEAELINRPLRISDFGGPQGLQALIDASVHGADSSNSAEAWFTVAWLRSIGGDDQAALDAVKKARDAGLSADLLDKLTLRVSPNPA